MVSEQPDKWVRSEIVATRGSRVNKDNREHRARRDHRVKPATVVRPDRLAPPAIPVTVARTVLLGPRAQWGLRDSRARRANRVSRVPLDSRVLPAGPVSREMLAVLDSLEQLESLVSLAVAVSLDRWEPPELRGRSDHKDRPGSRDRREHLAMPGRSGLPETPDRLGQRESRVQLGQREVLDSPD